MNKIQKIYAKLRLNTFFALWRLKLYWCHTFMSSVNIVTIGTNISRPQNAEYLRVCISNFVTCKKKIPLNASLHPWYDCLLANQKCHQNNRNTYFDQQDFSTPWRLLITDISFLSNFTFFISHQAQLLYDLELILISRLHCFTVFSWYSAYIRTSCLKLN